MARVCVCMYVCMYVCMNGILDMMYAKHACTDLHLCNNTLCGLEWSFFGGLIKTYIPITASCHVVQLGMVIFVGFNQNIHTPIHTCNKTFSH